MKERERGREREYQWAAKDWAENWFSWENAQHNCNLLLLLLGKFRLGWLLRALNVAAAAAQSMQQIFSLPVWVCVGGCCCVCLSVCVYVWVYACVFGIWAVASVSCFRTHTRTHTDTHTHALDLTAQLAHEEQHLLVIWRVSGRCCFCLRLWTGLLGPGPGPGQRHLPLATWHRLSFCRCLQAPVARQSPNVATRTPDTCLAHCCLSHAPSCSALPPPL